MSSPKHTASTDDKAVLLLNTSISTYSINSKQLVNFALKEIYNTIKVLIISKKVFKTVFKMFPSLISSGFSEEGLSGMGIFYCDQALLNSPQKHPW